jgi:hypothetical protein
MKKTSSAILLRLPPGARRMVRALRRHEHRERAAADSGATLLRCHPNEMTTTTDFPSWPQHPCEG